MELNKQNIKSKEFTEQRNGYIKEEVKLYLSELANEFEINNNKIINLEKEVGEQKNKLDEYHKIETELRNTLLAFNEPEKKSIIKAKKKAIEMIDKAEKKAEFIVYNAEEKAKSARDSLLFLNEQHEILLARLKIIIDSQEGILNEFRDGNNSASLKKTLAEAAAFNFKAELNIDSIMEKLL